jgi:hypothetical protein
MTERPEGETYEGHSELGFSLATKNAVEDYERRHGKPGGEGVTLQVLEMTVTFENPIRDYRVLLGPVG